MMGLGPLRAQSPSRPIPPDRAIMKMTVNGPHNRSRLILGAWSVSFQHLNYDMSRIFLLPVFLHMRILELGLSGAGQ